MTDLGGFGGAVSSIHPADGNKESRNLFFNIVSNFNIVKASIEDCFYLFGEKNIDSYIEEIHNLGVDKVIITLGSKGSVISNNSDLIEIPGFKTKVKDTTGAGDVYCAAFLKKYLESNDLYESGIYASAASSLIIEKTGGVSIKRMATDTEVKDLINKDNNN